MKYPITPEDVREVRMHYGYSQTKFGETMGITATSTVCRWEKGKNAPSRDVRRKIWHLANMIRAEKRRKPIPEDGPAVGWPEPQYR